MIFMPYTYCITFLKTNQRYYGVKFSKNSAPSDLGKSYFSSSKLVKQLIEKHGVDSFIFEVRRVFTCSDKARSWESKVHRRLNCAESIFWLNKHNQGEKFNFDWSGMKRSVDFKRKISEANRTRVITDATKELWSKQRKGRSPWNKGLKGVQKCSEETRKKISQSSLGRKQPPRSESWVEKQKIAQQNRSEEIKIKTSNSLKNQQKYSCVKCGMRVTKSNLVRWHNEKCSKR